MLKPPNQHRDKSPATQTTPPARFVTIPLCHFAAIDTRTIEPKSQPGRKRGNQGNQGNQGNKGARLIFRDGVCGTRGELGNWERGLDFGTEYVERGELGNKELRLRRRNGENRMRGTGDPMLCRRNGKHGKWGTRGRNFAIDLVCRG